MYTLYSHQQPAASSQQAAVVVSNQQPASSASQQRLRVVCGHRSVVRGHRSVVWGHRSVVRGHITMADPGMAWQALEQLFGPQVRNPESQKFKFIITRICGLSDKLTRCSMPKLLEAPRLWLSLCSRSRTAAKAVELQCNT